MTNGRHSWATLVLSIPYGSNANAANSQMSGSGVTLPGVADTLIEYKICFSMESLYNKFIFDRMHYYRLNSNNEKIYEFN